jgi:hypothetical protein
MIITETWRHLGVRPAIEAAIRLAEVSEVSAALFAGSLKALVRAEVLRSRVKRKSAGEQWTFSAHY